MGELTGSTALIAQLPAGTREAVVDAFSGSITTAFAIAVPIALAALLLVVFLPELPLRESAHVGAGKTKPQWPQARSGTDAVGSQSSRQSKTGSGGATCAGAWSRSRPFTSSTNSNHHRSWADLRSHSRNALGRARPGDLVHAHADVAIPAMVDPIGVGLDLESPIQAWYSSRWGFSSVARSRYRAVFPDRIGTLANNMSCLSSIGECCLITSSLLHRGESRTDIRSMPVRTVSLARSTAVGAALLVVSCSTALPDSTAGSSSTIGATASTSSTSAPSTTTSTTLRETTTTHTRPRRRPPYPQPPLRLCPRRWTARSRAAGRRPVW